MARRESERGWEGRLNDVLACASLVALFESLSDARSDAASAAVAAAIKAHATAIATVVVELECRIVWRIGSPSVRQSIALLFETHCHRNDACYLSQVMAGASAVRRGVVQKFEGPLDKTDWSGQNLGVNRYFFCE